MSWGGFFKSILGIPGVQPVVKHLIPLGGENMTPEDRSTEERIQKVLDTDPDLVAAKQRGAGADELEGLLRQKLPEDFKNWRLRESDSTSSGFRPTQMISKKRAAAYTAAGVAGGVGGAYALGAVGGGGGAGAGGSVAGGAGGAGAGAGAGGAAAGGILPSTTIAPYAGTLPAGLGATGSGAVGTALAGGGTTAATTAATQGVRAATTAGRLKQAIGPIASQLISGYMAKRAQDDAMQRSPEELAALSGANATAGQLTGLGGDLATGGQQNTAAASQFFNTLLHGSRSQMSQATAGPRGAITDVYSGAERGLERSGVRGAEKDVASGELQRQKAGQIAGLTTGVQPGAANALSQIGGQQSSTAGSLFGNAGNIYARLLGEANANRLYADQQGMIAGNTYGNLAGSILAAYLGGAH